MTLYTQRHYNDMAFFLTTIKGQLKQKDIELLADALSVRFSSDNEKFDTTKWYKAVGVTTL